MLRSLTFCVVILAAAGCTRAAEVAQANNTKRQAAEDAARTAEDQQREEREAIRVAKDYVRLRLTKAEFDSEPEALYHAAEPGPDIGKDVPARWDVIGTVKGKNGVWATIVYKDAANWHLWGLSLDGKALVPPQGSQQKP